MENWDQIDAVERMQEYIRDHAGDEPFCWDRFYRIAGYSRRHADRLFRNYLSRTPREYLQAVRLSRGAQELLDESKTVLDVALDTSFDSHEGFTRAFKSRFGLPPEAYRKEKPPIPLFVQYPVRHYYNQLYPKEERVMEKEPVLCMVTRVSRPARKLLFLRSKRAKDYWSYCEEMGCDWEGLFNSIPSKFDTAAILELPEFLKQEGVSPIASGVEVPLDFAGRLPEGWEVARLEPCEMLYFQSEPFEKEEEFGAVIDAVFRAKEQLDPRKMGCVYDLSAAPSFNFGAAVETGAKIAVPVKPL